MIVRTIGVVEAELAEEAATVGHKKASLFVAHVAFEFLQHGSLVCRVDLPTLFTMPALASILLLWMPTLFISVPIFSGLSLSVFLWMPTFFIRWATSSASLFGLNDRATWADFRTNQVMVSLSSPLIVVKAYSVQVVTVFTPSSPLRFHSCNRL